MLTKLRGASRFIGSVGEMVKMTWQAHPLACFTNLGITIVQGLLPLATAWITKVLLDWLALSLTGERQFSIEQIAWLLLAQAVVAVAVIVLPHISQYLNAELGRRLAIHIQQTVYSKINSFAGIAQFENPKIYDTIRLAQQGADFSTGRTLQVLTQAIQNLVTLSSFIVVLLSFNLLLALLVFVSAVPHFIAQWKLGKQRFVMAFDLSLDERRKFYYSFLLSRPEPAKEIRLFGLGQYFLERLIRLYKSVHTAERRLEQKELRWQSGLGFLSSLVASIAFVVAIFAAFNQRISIGDVTLFVGAVASVQSALNGIVFAVTGLNECVLFHSYYKDLMSLQTDLKIKKAPRSAGRLKKEITIQNVSFRYHEDQPWILRNINLTIPVGSCLALVGINGAGKTTLVKLLTRMYDPTEGEILWDGIDIREFDPTQWRKRIGAIFQDYISYDLSIRENIGVGDLARLDDSEWIEHVAAQANINDDIVDMPEGYDTEVSRMFAEGGQGFDLSGGQWQKIATARLFARDADLLLLDEPTAALDAESEYEVYSRFTELMENRTSVLISHRFSTVKMAKAIAVLEDGRISEYGSHQTLIKNDATYARLYRMQAESYQSDENPVAAKDLPAIRHPALS